MHGDPGYPRFFAEVSLFLFFMTGLVLANNFILLYACWEGVGLCSYLADRLLVRQTVGRRRGPQGVPGHAHRRRRPVPRHPAALVEFRPSLDYDSVFANAANSARSTACCSDGLPAAVHAGRSASRPSSRCTSGLPDAMEGPTPVSAPDPRRDDGDGRRLPGRPLHAAVRPRAGRSTAGRRLHRRLHGPAWPPSSP